MKPWILAICLASPASFSTVASAQQPQAAASDSREVRVVLKDGTRRGGRLLLLTDTEVVLRPIPNARESRYKLSDVRTIETVYHHRRHLMLLGLAAGFVIALAEDWCGTGTAYGASTEPGCITAVPMLITAGGAGVGALIGAELEKRRSVVLFTAPPENNLRPYLTVSNKQTVAGLRISW